jgi:3-oxoacyl-ACP reductase-like protein
MQEGKPHLRRAMRERKARAERTSAPLAPPVNAPKKRAAAPSAPPRRKSRNVTF